MRFQYLITGRNTTPCWRVTRRRQGRQTRIMFDLGRYWVGLYFI